MENLNEIKTNETLQTSEKQVYVKPECEVIKMELEQPILNGSAERYTPDRNF